MKATLTALIATIVTPFVNLIFLWLFQEFDPYATRTIYGYFMEALGCALYLMPPILWSVLGAWIVHLVLDRVEPDLVPVAVPLAAGSIFAIQVTSEPDQGFRSLVAALPMEIVIATIYTAIWALTIRRVYRPRAAPEN